jgi:hypothetical protein
MKAADSPANFRIAEIADTTNVFEALMPKYTTLKT